MARGVLNTTGDHFVYTVPPGYSLIVKTVILSSAASTAGLDIVQLVDRTQTIVVRLETQTLAATQFAVQAFEVVLNDGDSIDILPATTPLYYWVSGALLPYAVGQVAPA